MTCIKGPALLTLQSKYDTSIETISLMFLLTSIGGLVGIGICKELKSYHKNAQVKDVQIHKFRDRVTGLHSRLETFHLCWKCTTLWYQFGLNSSRYRHCQPFSG